MRRPHLLVDWKADRATRAAQLAESRAAIDALISAPDDLLPATDLFADRSPSERMFRQ
jgi:hypothetical protein